MNRLERSFEWVMNRWGHTATRWMWADNRLTQALGLVLALVGILVVGAIVALFVVVDSTKKRCSAKNASRSATSRR